VLFYPSIDLVTPEQQPAANPNTGDVLPCPRFALLLGNDES
jgi:hypothetical protein